MTDDEREAQIRKQGFLSGLGDGNFLLRRLNEARAEIARLRAPPGADAMEQARVMVARWEHGSDEHRQWLRDMCVPEVAHAIEQAALAARELALEEAAQIVIEMPVQIYRDEGIGPAGRTCKPATFDDAVERILALGQRKPEPAPCPIGLGSDCPWSEPG